MNLGWLEVSLDVADVGRSRSFYETLGFQAISTADAGMSVTMQAGDCRLALYQGVLGPPEHQLIFWQGDVEHWAGAMGEFVQNALTVNDKGEAAVMLRDPDGQLIYLIREHGQTHDMPATAELQLDLGYFEVSLDVKDIAITQAFYERLGFQLVDQIESGTNVTLANHDCRISLYKGHLTPARTQLIFWQGDVQAVADHVRSAGLSLVSEPKADAEGGKAFMMQDADGTPLYFINLPSVVRKNAA